MDPMSVIASVIGIAAVALHSTKRMMEFIDGIQGAPQAVKALSRDLSALEKVLQKLNDVLGHPDFQDNERRTELATLLQDPLDNCTLALDDISLAIRPYTKPLGTLGKSKWRGFTWSFREKEIATLQRMLMSYKSSLTMAVAVANLSTTSTGFGETKRQIRGLQHHLNMDSRSVADSSFRGSEATGSDPGFTLRRYLLQSDSISDTAMPPSPLIPPGVGVAEINEFPRLTYPKDAAAFSEIDGEQIYEMGSNFSATADLSEGQLDEAAPQERTVSDPSPTVNKSQLLKPRDADASFLEPPVFAISHALDAALSTVRPTAAETVEGKTSGPFFGMDLDLLYQRDGVAVPRVVRYCIAVAEQVGRRMSKVYDLEANQNEITDLKDKFDNGRPVQVNARAIFDHRTMDPRKLKFSKGDQILVLEPRDERWVLGLRQNTRGLLPIEFVQFSVDDIAGIIGTCKAFFMDLPVSLLPMVHYDSLSKSPVEESATYIFFQIRDAINELPLPRLELLKTLILHLHRMSMQPSDNTSTAMDLARSWAPILMRSDDESSVTEQERELQVRVVQALIASAEEVFETDPTEKFTDPSFSSVALMPDIKPLITSERERSRNESSTAPAMLRRSLWQSTVSSAPQVVSKRIEIIESSGGLLRIYHDNVSAAEVLNLWTRLETHLGSGQVDTRLFARPTLAVGTLLKALIAAKPHPLIVLEDSDLASPTTATEVIGRYLSRSTQDGPQPQTSVPETAHYEILKAVMLHLWRISEKHKNAFSLAQIWTPIFTQKTGSPPELRPYCDFVQDMIMNAYELFQEPRPQDPQPTIYELE